MQRRSKWKLFGYTCLGFLTGLALFLFLSGQQKVVAYHVESPDSVDSPHFRRVLSDLMGPPVLDGNQVKTLLNGEQIFPAMLEAIAKAEKTITFESYIYWSGQVGAQFAKALADRAQNGVKVHVLIDWVGSQKIDPDYVNLMEKAGVQIERYHKPDWYNFLRMNNRTHRKILVVDGRVGFTGGVGIADEWDGNGLDPARWRDTHYEVRGPVVAQMQSAFLDNWMKLRPEVHQTPDYFPPIEPETVGGAAAQMLKSTNHEANSSVRILYLIALASAKRSIHLESAYFLPDEVTVRELVRARERGVDVQIIVPSDLTDSQVVQTASQDTWHDLLSAGVRLFRYEKAMFHCKVLIIDEFFVSVGSTNFDPRSFNLNDEANLNVLDVSVAQEQEKVFASDRERSSEILLADWKKRPLLARALEKITSLASSQL